MRIINAKTSSKIFKCKDCEFKADRDHNAARNILLYHQDECLKLSQGKLLNWIKKSSILDDDSNYSNDSNDRNDSNDDEEEDHEQSNDINNNEVIMP